MLQRDTAFQLRSAILRSVAVVLFATLAVLWNGVFETAYADDSNITNELATPTIAATGKASSVGELATPAPIPTGISATSTPAPIPTPVTPGPTPPIVPTATPRSLSTPGSTPIPATAVPTIVPPTVAPPPTSTPFIIPATATPRPEATRVPPKPTAVPQPPTATPQRPPPTAIPTATLLPPSPTAFVPTPAPTATADIFPTATRVIIVATRVPTRVIPPTIAAPIATATIAPDVSATPTSVNTPIPSPTGVFVATATAEVVTAPTPLAKPKLNYAIYTQPIGASLPDVSFVGVHVFNEVKLKKAPIFGIAPASDIKVEVRMDLPARIIEAEAAGGDVEMTGQTALLRAASLPAADDLQFNLGIYAPDMKRVKFSVSDSNGPMDLAPAGALLPALPRPLAFTSADELGRQVAVINSGPSALPADPRTPIIIGLFLASALFAIAGTAIGFSWINKRR